MKLPLPSLFLLFGLCGLSSVLFAQHPPICDANAIMMPTCQQSCVVCDIDGFTGTNNEMTGWVAPPGFCSQVYHNLQWIGFLAGSTDLTLEVDVSNCDRALNFFSNGLQIGIYEANNCLNPVLISNCDQQIPNNTSQTFTVDVPLVIGQYYWFVMDGYSGDVCDYTVTVLNGSTEVPPVTEVNPIEGPLTTCPNFSQVYTTLPVDGATQYEWLLNGRAIGYEDFQQVSFPAPGRYSLCVRPSNVCSEGPVECIEVIVEDIPDTDINRLVCPGDTVQFHGDVYNSPGVYPFNYTLDNGCDSTVFLVVDTLGVVRTPLSATICADEYYFIGTDSFNTAALHTVTTVSSIGCDSIIELNLTVNPVIETPLADTICGGDVYIIATDTFTVSGNYQIPLFTIDNCDSMVNLDLTVLPVPESYVVDTICQGVTYSLGTLQTDSTGSYQVRFTQATGCDSIVFVDLTVLPPLMETVQHTLCFGDTLLDYGQPLFATDTTIFNLQNNEGCDSILIVEVIVLPRNERIVNGNFCNNTAFQIDTFSFTAAGNYPLTYTAENGCDSFVVVNLSTFPFVEESVDDTLCFDEFIIIGQDTFRETTVDRILLQTSSGCDSFVNLNVFVYPLFEDSLVRQICAGDSVVIQDSIYRETGFYTYVSTAGAGCVATTYLDLTVSPVINEALNRQICEGDTLLMGGQPLFAAGVYPFSGTSAAGCDSTLVVDLEVFSVLRDTVRAEFCRGDSLVVENQTITNAGQYSFDLVSSLGCDSVLQVFVTLNEAFNVTDQRSICVGDTTFVNGSAFFRDTVYSFSSTTTAGCDSIFTLDLSVNSVYADTLDFRICAGDTVMVGSTAFSETGSTVLRNQTIAGCDSTVLVTVTVFDVLRDTIRAEFCRGDSLVVEGQSLQETGNYTFDLTSSLGCDSILEVELVVNELAFVNEQQSICFGDTVFYNNEAFFEEGIYLLDLLTTANCDSIFTLDLTVNQVYQDTLDFVICTGDTVTVGSERFAETGTFELPAQTALGCDSNTVVTILANPVYTTPISAVICEDEYFRIGQDSFNTTGQHPFELASVDNCDSLIVLDLVVLGFDTTLLVETICRSDVFAVGDTTFNQPGNYEVTLTGDNLCDSIVFLDLSVFACGVAATSSITEVTCHGDSTGGFSFTIIDGNAPFEYRWQHEFPQLQGAGTVADLDQEVTVSDLPEGDIDLYITDAQGLMDRVRLTIMTPLPLITDLVVSSSGATDISCAGASDGAVSSTTQGGVEPYFYQWSNGSTNPDLENLAAGDYTVTIVDANGCTTEQTINLEAPPQLVFETVVLPPECDQTNGIIEIYNTSGGVGGYAFSINGAAYTPDFSFGDLSEGEYVLSVQDENGCTVDTLIFIDESPRILVDIGKGLSVELGDSILLNPVYSVIPDSVFWEGPNMGCTDCLQPMVQPTETSEYAVWVVDANGCTASDIVTVLVEKETNVFVPSAFSPNGDGINDLFFPYSDASVRQVLDFKIFDRWGELVFTQSDFPTNTSRYGWDGRFRGEPMDPSVFVYSIEVEFIDGTTESFKGDVTIVK